MSLILERSFFGSGQTPTICLVNEASTPLGYDLSDLAEALQMQADQVSVIWGCDATVVLSDSVKPNCWGLVILDNADQAGALGYHDLTADGLPQGKAFVLTSQQDNDDPATVISHELCEMMVDPDCNTFKLWQRGNSTYLAVLEVADPVEGDSYLITLPDGKQIPVSDWVYPSWFQTFTTPGTKLDYLGLCKQPFEIRAGGYLPALNLATGQWEQLRGSDYVSGRPRNRSARRQQLRLS